MNRSILVPLLGSLVLLASAAAAPPPATPAASGESFDETIEVTVVNVDVVVRDRSGKQVGGLGRDDFSLTVDGRQVPIVNFAGPDEKAAASPSTSSAAPAALTPPTASSDTAAPQAHRQPLSLAVFIDNANLRPYDRDRLLKQLRGFLRSTLTPGDHVLVVTHDRSGMHRFHSFRDGVDDLSAALDMVDRSPAGGLERDMEMRNTIHEMLEILESDNGCQDGVEQAADVARAHSGRVLADIKATYADLHNLLDSLAGVTGRKGLLYIGDGVATRVGSDAEAVLEDACGVAKGYNRTRNGFLSVDATVPMRQVIADANSSQVTVFTLEGTGQASYLPSDPVLSVSMSRDIDIDRQNSLTSLARETGGRAALNGTDFTHDLGEIAGELAASYSLGFTPPAAAPGKEHTIRVELERPGLRASYRTAYRDRTAEERMEGVVEAALIDGQVDNPLDAAVKLGPTPAAAKGGERGTVLVPLSLRVPFGKLTFVPADDGQHGHVTIFVASMDSEGAQAPIQRALLPLRLPAAGVKKVLASTMGYDLKLVVKPGRQRIVLAVRDDVARIASTLLEEIEVDKTGAATRVAAAAPVSKLR